MNALQVGIITQTMVQQHHLRTIVESNGHSVYQTYLIQQIVDQTKTPSEADVTEVNLWLVDVDFDNLADSTAIEIFESWLFGLDQPVIFGEGLSLSEADETFKVWIRQVTEKLLQVASELARVRENEASADFVWVLGASTGGPEAVKKFLDRVPAGFGLAFVYAQHIEAGVQKRLAQTITRDSEYQGRLAEHGATLAADTLTIVPSEQQLDILADGTLLLRSEAWRGQYRPSIDQVSSLVANRFGQRSGVIFFSGMGDDGVTGAKIMACRHGKVWVQSLSTCTIDTMPSNVSKTGCVSAMGSPEQLAGILEKEMKSWQQQDTAARTRLIH